MSLGKDPSLEREPRSVGSERHEVFIFRHYPDSAFGFLTDDIAENATLFVDVILLGSLEFFEHVNGQNRQGNELRMGVLERRSGCLTMILKIRMYLKRRSFLRSRMRSRKAHRTSSILREGNVAKVAL